MSDAYEITRRCKDCPKRTQTVCLHVFGKYWKTKSADGKGCNHPLDGVAAAWKKAGCTPEKGETVPITLSVKELPKAKPGPEPQKKVSQVQVDLFPDERPPLTDDDY